MSRARASAHAEPARFALEGGALAILEPSHALPLVSLVVALRSGSALDPAGKRASRASRRACSAAGARGWSPSEIDEAHRRPRRRDGRRPSPSRRGDPRAGHRAQRRGVRRAPGDACSATPTFPSDEVERLKRETTAEIVEARDSDRVARDGASGARSSAVTVRAHARGTIPGVQTISREDVAAFYKRHVTQANAGRRHRRAT